MLKTIEPEDLAKAGPPMTFTRARFQVALVGGLALSFATLHLQAQWPEFRGPGGSGTVKGRSLPLTWGEGENVAVEDRHSR